MKAFIGCLVLAVTLVTPASADLFINGLLQPGPSQVGLPGPTFVTLYAGQTIGDVTGSYWTVTNGGTNPADTDGSVDWIGGYTYWVPPPNGGHSVDLDGLAPGGISQVVTTTAGDTYTLSFYLAGNPGGPPTVKTLLVNAFGSVGSASEIYTYTLPDPYPSPFALTTMDWQQEFFQFTAESTSTTIAFTSQDLTDLATAGYNPPSTSGEAAYGPVVGGISLSLSVPEASSSSYLAVVLSFACWLMFVRRNRHA
jgi:hypothetical protein